MNYKIPRYQHGFLLIVAVFVLLVLSAVSLSILSLSNTRLQQSETELLYQRAYYAAKSALDLASVNMERTKKCEPQTITFSEKEHALQGFVVKVNCQNLSGDVNSTYRQIKLIAQASHGAVGEPNFVRRSLIKTLTI